MKLIFWAFCASLPTFLLAKAIVVTADRIPSPLDTTSNEIYIIPKKEMTKLQGQFIWEELKETPGLTVSNTGGQGQSTTLSIRGADSRHSLVLFEGIELNDASTTGNLSDLALLSFDGLERVEILPGSQSVLYGSDAIGGVLSLNLVDLEKVSRPHFIYSGSIGSNKSHSLGITHYSALTKKLKLFLNASQISTDGINQTSILSNKQSEEDGHFLGSVTGKFLYQFSDSHSVSVLSKLSSSTTEIDKGFGSPRDDSNYETKSRNFLYKIESKNSFMNGSWEPTISFSSVSNKRSDEDLPDTLSTTISTFESRFKREKLILQNNIFLSANDTLIGGFEYETESGNTQNLSSGTLSGLNYQKEESNSVFLSYKRSDQIFWSSGFRVQNFNDESKLTFKVAPGIKISNFRTWLSISSGFKNPSLFQRNSSSFGNQNLKPEESMSYEWGNSFEVPNLLSLSLTFFHLDIENLIDTTGTFPNISYVNLNKAKSTGLNLGLSSHYLDINLTRKNARDSNGFELINRPKFSSSVSGKFSFNSYLLKLTTIYKGPRDSGSTFSRTRLPGFTLLNSSISYDFRKTLLLWLNINNLLDKEYTDVTGYNTDGVNFKLGFNWRY